jgi:hypothetical protein
VVCQAAELGIIVELVEPDGRQAKRSKVSEQDGLLVLGAANLWHRLFNAKLVYTLAAREAALRPRIPS